MKLNSFSREIYFFYAVNKDKWLNLAVKLLPTIQSINHCVRLPIINCVDSFVVLTIVFSCIEMKYNYRMLRNVFGMSLTPWHPMANSEMDIRPAFPSELTVMLWVDSNHLPSELQAIVLTTHPLNSLLIALLLFIYLKALEVLDVVILVFVII